jgi:hypothetical protein
MTLWRLIGASTIVHDWTIRAVRATTVLRTAVVPGFANPTQIA